MLVFFNTGFNFVVCRELISDHSPVLDLASVPFFVKLGNSEIEQFEQCIFVWKSTFFGDLAKARIDAFNRICCVHNFSNSTSVIEKLLYMVEISLPYIYCSRVLRPLLTELLKGFSRGCTARCSVHFLYALCEFFVVLAWHIFN